MEGRRDSLMPPVIALAVTIVLALTLDRLPVEGESAELISLWALGLTLVFPFLVSGLWGWALITGPDVRRTLGAGVVVAVVLLMLTSGVIAWQTISLLTAGIVAGWALAARWRLDAGWSAVLACLAPLLIWSAVQLPVQDMIQEMRDSALTNLEQTLWLELEEPELSRARELQEKQLDDVAALVARIYPSFLAIGAIGQAGVILALVLWFGRLGGRRPGLRGTAPFVRWRLPFYVVWSLVAGLGLLLTRAPIAASAGLNVALIAALLLAIQGLSVQAYFAARLMSGPVQVVFWLIMGIPLVGVLVVSSLLLGLADQWFDLRRRYSGGIAGREVE